MGNTCGSMARRSKYIDDVAVPQRRRNYSQDEQLESYWSKKDIIQIHEDDDKNIKSVIKELGI
jgi:hypothetical protein